MPPSDPFFWLIVSTCLLAVSLATLLITAIPALLELTRMARTMDRFFDTLNRELPPTLEALRLTGLEISELTEDINQGVSSATEVVKQIDKSIGLTKQTVSQVQIGTKSIAVGIKVAWQKWRNSGKSKHISASDS
ncbi:MAG: DUF948 domain-containing protein [Cyanobacteria bacterium J083]|nr:MAG: DUF948 domain-containing protein [Cyanobacteria bacterium J083]